MLTLGAMAGLGLLLLSTGLTRPAPRPSDDAGGPSLLLAGVVVGLLAGVAAWLLSGWPVLTLAAMAGGLLLPRTWAARTQAAEQAARSEAVAEVAAGLRDGVRQHQLRQRDDQSGLFGQRQEGPWRQQAAFRVIPPHQCLHAGQAALYNVHDRLVVQLELAGNERLAHVSFHSAPRFHVHVHARLEEARCATSLALGPVHG